MALPEVALDSQGHLVVTWSMNGRAAMMRRRNGSARVEEHPYVPGDGVSPRGHPPIFVLVGLQDRVVTWLDQGAVRACS